MNEKILEFSRGAGEPAWLTDLRAQAFDAIAGSELPFIQRVKYDRWGLDALSDLTAVEAATGAVPDFAAVDNHPLVVQENSATVYQQLPQSLADAGVVFTDFATALTEIPEVIQANLGAAVKFDEDRLAAVNTANFDSGVVLYVPDDVEIALPVETILNQKGAAPFTKRILIIAGKHSKLNYLERLSSLDAADAGLSRDKAIANVIVEVIAGEGSQIKFSAIDQLGVNVNAFINRRGLVKSDATIDWALGVMNDGNVIADFDSDLVGTGSHSELKAVGISMGKQTQGIDTRVTNYAKKSVGHILQHGVILEAGTLTLNGIGHIINGASGADAQQESRVLMLSDKARADANPILLIDENDVTAGHAASIGQVDPDDMYYLMSRGLDEDTAKRLVIRGFLGAVVAAIPLKSVRDEFLATIDRKLAI